MHLHILSLDGVYTTPATEGVAPRLHALAGPSDEDVGAVVEKIAKRTVKLLRHHGYLDYDTEFVIRPDADDMFQDNAAISAALGDSVQSKIAFGPRAGQFVRKIGKGFGFKEEHHSPRARNAPLPPSSARCRGGVSRSSSPT